MLLRAEALSPKGHKKLYLDCSDLDTDEYWYVAIRHSNNALASVKLDKRQAKELQISLDEFLS